MPLNPMLCGEPVALSVIVIAAVNAPVALGAKSASVEHFAPAPRLVPHVFVDPNDEASVPVTLMLVMDKVAVPEFVIVNDCDALDVPSAWVPKDRLVFENVTWAAAKEVISRPFIARKSAGITFRELLKRLLTHANMMCSLSV